MSPRPLVRSCFLILQLLHFDVSRFLSSFCRLPGQLPFAHLLFQMFQSRDACLCVGHAQAQLCIRLLCLCGNTRTAWGRPTTVDRAAPTLDLPSDDSSPIVLVVNAQALDGLPRTGVCLWIVLALQNRSRSFLLVVDVAPRSAVAPRSLSALPTPQTRHFSFHLHVRLQLLHPQSRGLPTLGHYFDLSLYALVMVNDLLMQNGSKVWTMFLRWCQLVLARAAFAANGAATSATRFRQGVMHSQPVLHFRMLHQPVGALLTQGIGLCEQQLHLLLQIRYHTAASGLIVPHLFHAALQLRMLALRGLPPGTHQAFFVENLQQSLLLFPASQLAVIICESVIPARTCAPDHGERLCACPTDFSCSGPHSLQQLGEVCQHVRLGVVRCHIPLEAQQEFSHNVQREMALVLSRRCDVTGL